MHKWDLSASQDIISTVKVMNNDSYFIQFLTQRFLIKLSYYYLAIVPANNHTFNTSGLHICKKQFVCKTDNSVNLYFTE